MMHCVNIADEASEAGLRGLVQIRMEAGGVAQAAKAITDGLSGQQIADVTTACEAQEVSCSTAPGNCQDHHWLWCKRQTSLSAFCCWFAWLVAVLLTSSATYVDTEVSRHVW